MVIVTDCTEDVGNHNALKSLKEQGNKYFNDGEYDNALLAYSQALTLTKIADEERATLFRNRAAVNLKLNKYDLVIKDTSDALAFNPNDVKALFRRCQAYEANGSYEEAYMDARNWHNLDPKNKSVQPVLSRLHKHIQEIVKIKSTTGNRVTEMMSIVFGDSGSDSEKRVSATNNLVVLARENTGADLLLKNGICAKIVILLKRETNLEIIVASIRIIGEICRDSVPRAKQVLKEIGVLKLIELLNTTNDEQIGSVQFLMQLMLNTLSGMDVKKDVKPDRFLLEENKVELDSIMAAVLSSINSRAMAPKGRDSLIELVLKNSEVKALHWAPKIVKTQNLWRLLEVGCEIQEYSYESSIPITESTRTVASVTLQAIYDNTECDKERDEYKLAVEEFIKEKLLGPEIENKVRVTALITTLLRGPLDVGNACLAKDGILEMMLVMAGQDDEPLQQLVAAEAIIAAASKKDKCTSIITLGVNILKKLYNSPNDAIKVRALVGLCKVGSHGGTDASIKPFADGSAKKLSLACRKFLVNPAKDKDLRKWAAEGLSFLTLDADIKEELVGDKNAFNALIELAKTGSEQVLYGAISCFVNLTNSYDKQDVIPEMMELAKFAKQHVPEEHEKDGKNYIDSRIVRICEMGITVALVALSKTESKNSRELIARVFNAICELQEMRGIVVQQGGAKVLIGLALDGTDNGKLQAAQAVARIGITINPELAFPGQRSLELVRPLVKLLHIDCSGLQNFEGLMALCNLASMSDTVRTRIVSEQGITAIEHYMYEDHVMLKRAAVQCMLNLLLLEDVIKMFEFANDRVKFWTLLCGDEDYETSKAAAGGLAIVTAHSKKCCKKVFEANAWLESLSYLLTHRDEELQYRGVCVVDNMMGSRKSIAQRLIETPLMEAMVAVSQLPGGEGFERVRQKCLSALKRAEEWKLIKPREGEDLDSE